MLAKVSQYYKQKSHLEINDEYHEAIDQGDIDILRDGVIKVAVTPFAALLGMFVLSSIKTEFSKSSSFVY